MQKISTILLLIPILLISSHAQAFVKVESTPMNSVNIVSPDQTNDLQAVKDDFTLHTYDKDEAYNGLTAFVLWERDNTGPNWVRSIVTIMDMEGNIVASHINNNGSNRIYETQIFNSSTILYLTSGDDTPYLWNYKTDVVEQLNFHSGHHDIEYNPYTNTFMVKRFALRGEVNGLEIQHHDLYEYDKQGNVIWYWNSSEHFPFDKDLWTEETFMGQAQYLHANSIYWDVEQDSIYYNAKNFDTFYKIDKFTGDVEWGVGRLGNFTLIDKNGNERDSLWYHAHSVEKIGPNRFILYDNDDMNQTRSDPTAPGTTRMVEIKLNMENHTAREVWSYSSPEDHFSAIWGDANRLPNGNTIGSFGHFSHPAYLTEVNEAGEVVWEVSFDNSTDRSWGIFRVQRFTESPVIQIDKQSTNLDQSNSDENVYLNVWNTYQERHHSLGKLQVFSNDDLLFEREFEFKPSWQKTLLNIPISEIGSNNNEFNIRITNNDGISTEASLNIQVGTTTSDRANYLMIFGILGVMIPIHLRKKVLNE